MNISGLDGALWAFGVFGELLLLGILLYRRHYRTFPIFSAYLLWVIVSDPLLLFILYNPHTGVRAQYAHLFFTFNIFQFFVELLVLVEIGANVARPSRRSLSRKVLTVLATVSFLVGIAAFIFASRVNAGILAHHDAVFIADYVMAALRLLTFVVIAALAQILGLGWRNHVLQLASGLAFYAAVTLIASLARSHLHGGPDYADEYRRLTQLGVLGYLCSLYYWCYSFSRQEAHRKEFNSKMSDFLVSMSGTLKQQQSIVARKNR